MNENIYEVDLFKEKDFLRKKCEECGRVFWTLDPDRKTCGDTPCDEYNFIGNPPIEKNYTLPEMEKKFLSFFEDNEHTTIARYPVVARWRDDIYLTIASIADFQPWVTSGEAPPPANPLVVSQPSIRLNDIDNVGRSGRHLTLFFMGGHHAFNSEDNRIYWNDKTVEYCHRFLSDVLKISPEEITYIEDFWSGGGNAGEDFEVNVRGLELSTLVFMHYGLDGEGNRSELPINIVDTGYGMERLVWASQGTSTCYEAVFGPIISKIKDQADIPSPPKKVLEKHSKLAGLMDIETGRDLDLLRSRVSETTGIETEELDRLLNPLENVYAIADHLRCLAFMFGDGITPSNEGEGYLSRLVLRRTLRLMREIELETPLVELMKLELDHLKSSFPEIFEQKDYVLEVVDLEERRYRETLAQGKRLLDRRSSSLKAEGKSEIPTSDLIELYDSHGLPPEIVKEIMAEKEIKVEPPENFYMQVAQMHSQPEKETEREVKTSKGFELSDLPETELLYYENPYQQEFEGEVVDRKGNYIVLDRTAFYPEGGGQPADKGVLKTGGEEYEVLDVQKDEGVVLHEIESNDLKPGQKVEGKIDWGIRSKYMRHHTATHILLGALRNLLGNHVWQHGVKKGEESSRLDISHPKRITEEKLREIEKIANQIVFQNRRVNSFWMDRNVAEQKYGHALYQGGVVPGKKIRIVEIEDWNAQACAGTHCTRTGEVGLIKIIGRERIQDGVERLIFASGEPVLEAVQEREQKIKKAAETLRSSPGEIDEAVQNLFDQWKTVEKEKDSLRSRLADLQAQRLENNAKKFKDIRIIAEKLEYGDTDELIQIGEELIDKNPDLVVILGSRNDSANIIAMGGENALEKGANCGKITSKAAETLGGGGGGRPRLGQGGGTNVEKLGEAIKVAVETCKEQVE
ncbi:hypothetical protein AKJ37_04200 [candidate division MSBL1 archaeon SCGC-AAA259I09]|uniref:Alanine--tRNA ligase n=1 Tax=candidate division MSBL1 archaeon SCGC-AAA259I09 TaxID=1698267 RepID=A0A133URR1_9EURY|nr:hypothetical protein AKJ37_04200 [candidate division MSBL1 archaeon SCGC-AAA259I09]